MSNSGKLNRLRETRICSVPTCQNKRVGKKDDSGPSFHRFPKDPAIRKAWIEQCKIDCPNFNPDHGSICSEHFDFDDFERSYQKQLMGIERRPMLKKNVIPHLNLPRTFIPNYQGELKNSIKNKFENLIQLNNSNWNMSKKESKIETYSVSPKDDHTEAIIVDYESDLESLCVQSVEDHVDPLTTDHSTIENIRIETDYKALYLETIQKYEKLKSHVMEVENNLAKEKKRADNYQNMLTKIFAEGEMHLVHKKKN